MLPQLQIKEKADALLVNSGFAGQFPIPVDKIAKHVGYSCHYFLPDKKTADIAGAVNHEKKKIYVNKNDPLERITFTIAHEVGHIVLHSKDGDFVDYRRRDSSTNPKELEADSFAGNLLMPEAIFLKQWEILGGNFKDLASFFGVSKSAIGVRANNLGIG